MRWSWLGWSAVLLACRGHGPGPAAPVPAAAMPATQEVKVDFETDPETEGLGLRLYEAKPTGGAAATLPAAPSTALSPEATAGLLARLPALEGEEGDAVAFALRDGPRPPPRTGATVGLGFPPEESPGVAPAVESGPLTVLRRAPEGEVPMAPHLSVTFSQPMVAVTSQEEAAKTVPVKLTPTPPGSWRWLGTKTLLFQPDPRFPMATRYTVEVPAGTRSATGGSLGAATAWTFSTPAAKLQSWWPYEDGSWRRGVAGNPQPLDPLVFLGFDQRVDPAAVLGKLKLVGGEPVDLRLATAEEVAADPVVSARVKAAEPGRWVVVRPATPLQRSTTYRVVVPAGTPSAEGPLLTPADQEFQFRTYGPMRALKAGCWHESVCPPTWPWQVEFTNPIPVDRFDPAAITVEPKVAGLTVNVSGNVVQLSGAFVGRTTYTVRVAAGVPDVFGQTLAEPATFTIQVGPAEKTLVGPGEAMVVLDPAAPPALSVFTVNHKGLKVRIQRVKPEDWPAWMEWNNRWRWEDARQGALPGTRVHEAVQMVRQEPDRMAESKVDLGPYLQDGFGQFIVQVVPTEQPRDRWARQEWIGWVQVTKLGLTAFADGRGITGWVNDLATGKPAAGVSLGLIGGPTATADAQGLARLELGTPTPGLVARRGADVALVPSDLYGWSPGWVRHDEPTAFAWYLFDDKHLYKPSETVHVRGWLRVRTPGPTGDLAAATGVTRVKWVARSSLGNPLGEGTATVSGLGGFSFDIPLPRTPDLGTATVQLTAEGGDAVVRDWAHAFTIQEYRTPEFEVSTSGGDAVYALGEDALVDVSARYYAGGALPVAPVTWEVRATPASFVPPGRSDWSFGPWSPWWRWWTEPEPESPPVLLQGQTDAAGEHHLGVHFTSMKPIRPYTVTAQATVTDVNRQAWSSSRSFLVHPASWYVGLRTARPYVEAKEPFEVETLLVDRDGRDVPGGVVSLGLERLVWKNTGEGWKEVGEPAGAATVEPGTGKASFTPEVGGSYRLTATVVDPQGRTNLTELRLWVSGGDVAPDRGVEQERVTLIPEKETWNPGETASFLVQAPFWPAEGVLTVRRGGLLESRAFTMDGPSTTLTVPVTEGHIPDLTVAVDLVGQRPRTDDAGKVRADLAKRVAYAAGSLTFKVSTLPRALTVEVTPALARLDPGGSTSIGLRVTDAAGAPVPDAELAVVAVDEAVLALTGYRLPDPLTAFYAARGDGVSSIHLRQWTRLADPSTVAGPAADAGGFGVKASATGLMMEGTAPGGGGRSLARAKAGAMPMEEAAPMPSAPMADMVYAEGEKKDGEPSGPAIQLRADFTATALWAPSVRTDAQGRATVPLKLPDSLTRYRVMVVAVAGATRFGSGEADVTARLPLMVRPSAPRFLNFGDRFELPVVVQNQTDAPMTVDVGVRALNLRFTDRVDAPLDPATGTKQVGRRVTVPANDRVEVRFPASALRAGRARFQVAAAAGTYADAASGDLPVWTPATTEAFATYGAFEQGAMVQPVSPPKDVWAQFGGLEVTLASTQLQALTDAFVYLVKYPFDCNEQRASRVLAVAALRDVLGAFGSKELPSGEALAASVAEDLENLRRRQNHDGGWAFWRKNDPSWPYLSIHVTHALVRAKEKGYPVDDGMYGRALGHLASIERHIPGWYSKESRWALRAYALHVLHVAGEPDVAEAKRLLAEAGDGLSAEGRGWVLPTLVDGKATAEVAAIRSWMRNHVTESAAGAHFVTAYADGAQVLLHSDRRVDGVLLEALLRTDPKNDLVPKLVNGLLAHRTAGRWANTTESALVLLALDRYFHVYEGTPPDFVARVWLGEGFAGEKAFRGRTTDRAQIDVPMAWLGERGDQDLVLAKDGAGRVYYRVGLRYAPKDLDPDAADHGFTVERAYEAVDDPADVRRDPDGTWHLRAGARVRVRLTMATPMRRYHVALVDPLPAGLEVMNPDLAVSGALPPDPSASPGPYWWWFRTWYEHENLRDERVEAFASLLWDGVHTYTYVARATTPGLFVVPPARAEEMYAPETFGRSAGDRVVVE